jgi:hypothetical protein
MQAMSLGRRETGEGVYTAPVHVSTWQVQLQCTQLDLQPTMSVDTAAVHCSCGTACWLDQEQQLQPRVLMSPPCEMLGM